MKLKEALSFFSRLPSDGTALPKNFKGMFLCFPFVGLAIGVVVALIMGITDFFIPSLFVGFVGCITWLVLTGGVNLQGVAYCGDMLFTPISEKLLKHIELLKGAKDCALKGVQNNESIDVSEDTSEPNHETSTEKSVEAKSSSCCKRKQGHGTHSFHGHGYFSRIGVYGFTALFFVLATKTVALSLLATHYDIAYDFNSLMHVMFICIGTAMFARCVTFFATLMPTAKQEGLTYELTKPLFDFHYAVIGVLAFVICYFSGISAFFMLIVCGLFSLYLLLTAKKRLGGITDNVLACTTEVSECIALIAFCLYL